MAYLHRETKKTVRNLSRKYGKVGAVYRPVENMHDVRTGQVLRDYDLYIINRIIPMPFKIARNFVTTVEYTRLENQIQGGSYVTDERTFIIEFKELTTSLQEIDHIVLDAARYEITKIIEAEEMNGVLVDVRALQKVEPYSAQLTNYLEAGWTYNKAKSAFAIEELIFGIRFDVFGGNIPAGFDCLPLAGKNFSDALITLFQHTVVAPSTATADDYKEYGINGGVNDANLESDVGFVPSYAYYDSTYLSFVAGGVALSGAQQAVLDTVVARFNARLGRKP